MPQQSVYLVRSNNFTWVGLREALQRLPGMHVVGDGSAADVDTALAEVASLALSLVITTIPVEGMTTRYYLTSLKQRCPAARIVVVVDSFPRDDLSELAGAVVSGYLLWSDLTPASVHDCLAGVVAGLVVCSPALARAFLTGQPDPAGAPQGDEPLTQRQRDVLALLIDGMTDDEIAVQLGIDVSTVQSHVHNMLVQYDARHRAHLVSIAHRQRLLDR